MIRNIGFYTFNEGDDDESRRQLKSELSEVCLNHVKSKMGDKLEENVMLRRSVEAWEEKLANPEKTFLTDSQKEEYYQFLEMQRQFLIEKNKDENLNEDIVRRQQHLIDLEEERVIHS